MCEIEPLCSPTVKKLYFPYRPCFQSVSSHIYKQLFYHFCFVSEILSQIFLKKGLGFKTWLLVITCYFCVVWIFLYVFVFHAFDHWRQKIMVANYAMGTISLAKHCCWLFQGFCTLSTAREVPSSCIVFRGRKISL